MSSSWDRARWILVLVTVIGFTSFSILQVLKAFYELLKDSETETKKLISVVSQLLRRQPKDKTFIPTEFTNLQPDTAGVYTFACSPTSPAIYYRQSQSVNGLWEWSADQQLWQSSAELSLGDAPLPDAATMVFLARLYLEHVLRTKASGDSKFKCRFPPPLDLSHTKLPLEQAPDLICCPITHQVMSEPVVVPSGASFDRPAIMAWLQLHSTDPTSAGPLMPDDLYPNLALRDIIERWAQQGRLLATENGREEWGEDTIAASK